MIISKHKPFDEILDYVKDAEKIILIGCGECATVCQSGGEEQLLEIKQKLENQGKKVLIYIVPETSCNYLLVKKELRKNQIEVRL